MRSDIVNPAIPIRLQRHKLVSEISKSGRGPHVVLDQAYLQREYVQFGSQG